MTQLNTKIPAERLKYILKDFMDPLFKKVGFKKQGNKYKLTKNNLIYEVALQKSQWNTKDSLSFTFNFLIWLPEDLVKRLPFPFLAPALSGRISILCNNQDLWFELKTEDKDWQEKDKEVGQKLEKLAMENVLPFFVSIETIGDIINILEQPNTLRWFNPNVGGQTQEWIAILYYTIGQKEKSLNILDEAIKTTKSKLFKESLEELKDKMQTG